MRFEITHGVINKPQKVLIYGPEGIGKTTLASHFPNPLFIDVEGGTSHIDVPRLPRPDSWQMLLDEVTWVRDYPEECGGTLVVDTLDWAEKLCIRHVCGAKNWKGIEDPGYGRGFTYAVEEFGKLLNLLSEATERGLNVCVTAHASIVKFEQPDETGAYDRWGLKLIDGKRASSASLVKEWADAVLFCDWKTVVIAKDKDGKTARATGGRNRVMRCTHAATWDAKNRWGLPDEVPMDWSQIASFIPVPSFSAASSAFVATKEDDVPFYSSEDEGEHVVEVPDPTGASDQGAWPADGGWPARLTPLMQLMAADGISEDQVCAAVASKGYATRDQKLHSYPEEIINWVVSVWPQMRDFIRNGNQ